ncbi:MAG: helix-hairpin-helix domain-containing protein [Bacteroidota bacterium]
MKALALFFVASCAYGQERLAPDSLDGFQEIVETFLEEMDSGDDETESGDQLVQLSESPLDLNLAGLKELQQIPGVSPLTAYRIFTARNTRNFSDVTDLLLIEGIDETIYRGILPFVTIQSRSLAASFHVRSRLQTDLQNRRGFSQGLYSGGKQKLYSRTSFTIPVSQAVNLQGNFTSEKDPGELAADAFRSGFVTATFRTLRLTAGDFVVSSGNDHVFGGGAGIGRRRGRILRRAPAISGYRSADEQHFFRGMAVMGDAGTLSFGAFYSNKSVHGTFQKDGSVSVYHSGLFRTLSERSKRNVTRERITGGYLSKDLFAGLSVGLTGFDARFLEGRAPVRSIGLDAVWRGERGWLTGCLTRENSGGGSLSASASVDPLVGWSFFILHESFARGFSAAYALARAPVRGSTSAAGARVRLGRGCTLNASMYTEQFPEGKQGEGFSEYESGAMLESVLAVSPSFQVDLRIAARLSPARSDSRDSLGRSKSLRAIHEVRKYRMGFTAGRKGPMVWISRAEFVKATPPDEASRWGVMISQELKYTPSRHLKIRAKVMVFSIEAYDARIYSFESTVPGIVVNRVLSGEGSRSTLSVLCQITSSLDISASFSAEIKDGQRIIGSGLEEIPGDMYSRISVQIDVRL